MAKLRVDKIASVGVSTETTGSVFFDGSSDWLRARGGDNFDDFDFGSNDFTIEGFFYANDVNGTDIPIALAADTVGSNSDAGWYIRYQSNKIEGQSFSGSDNIGITTSGTVSNDTWYHVAYVREGSTFTLYVDGTAVDTATSSSSLNWNSGWKVEIGSGYGGANYFAGYISNLRICKGHAVYKSNFAPPTRELEVHQGPDDDRTVLLACYDGENIFAEKTGRHILASQGNRTSSPTLASGETPVGITTLSPGLTRDVDNTFGPTFQGGAGYNSQNWLTLPKGTTTDRNRTGGRGVFGGGTASPGSSNLNSIEFISITTQGNGQDFGDLITAARTKSGGGVSSPTRGVTAGGFTSSTDNEIEFFTIASTGNTVDFGADLTSNARNIGQASNSTRGLFAGGDLHLTAIDFITIATTGNCSSFGSLASPGRGNLAGCASPTRAIFGGGYTPSPADETNIIEFVTIASTGNATNFGDLTSARFDPAACSSSTRGVFAGGKEPAEVVTIDYVTIASAGNATDFGDLTLARTASAGMSNSIRGVFASGADHPLYYNTIDYITIASTGNASDFGDSITARQQSFGCSDSHGGLS